MSPKASTVSVPDQLPWWLEAVAKRFESETGMRCRDQFPELRETHRRMLQMIPPEGIRITDLAVITGRSKSGLTELINWLEQSGFVYSRKDPTDNRVRLISRTKLGESANDAINDTIASIEREWRNEIGSVNYDGMRLALRQLG
jgi:DNA-binding MarR family transcriptional regulator